MILTDGSIKVGLIVDRLLNEQDVLVKPLHEDLATIPGMGGATIMADGRVALVINAVELVKMTVASNNNHLLAKDSRL